MKHPQTQAKLQLIGALCIFGTISLFVRNIALGSGLIALSRGVLGAAFLLGLLALRHQKLDRTAIRKNLWILLLSGGVMGLNWALLFEAYRYTTVATATLCYYMQPIFLTLARRLSAKNPDPAQHIGRDRKTKIRSPKRPDFLSLSQLPERDRAGCGNI